MVDKGDGKLLMGNGLDNERFMNEAEGKGQKHPMNQAEGFGKGKGEELSMKA